MGYKIKRLHRNALNAVQLKKTKLILSVSHLVLPLSKAFAT